MPGERLSMRKIREVLRLRLGHKLPQRAVAQSLRLSQGAVSNYLSRARRAGLGWPLPNDLDDQRLEALLFPPPPSLPAEHRPLPDWASVHRELRRPNVALALLWEEYRGHHAANPFGRGEAARELGRKSPAGVRCWPGKRGPTKSSSSCSMRKIRSVTRSPTEVHITS